MENQSENPKTFAETKQPLLVNSAGVEITPELLLNDENILNELVSYYEWDNFDEKIVQCGIERVFLNYLAKFVARYIDDDTLNEFNESYKGWYNCRAAFAEDLYDKKDEVGNMDTALRYNINWDGVARDIEEMGSYTFLFEDKAYRVHVLCNK